jgi:hypothetical protein
MKKIIFAVCLSCFAFPDGYASSDEPVDTSCDVDDSASSSDDSSSAESSSSADSGAATNSTCTDDLTDVSIAISISSGSPWVPGT